MAAALTTFTEIVSGGFTIISSGLTFLLAEPLLLIPIGISIASGIIWKVKGAIG